MYIKLSQIEQGEKIEKSINDLDNKANKADVYTKEDIDKMFASPESVRDLIHTSDPKIVIPTTDGWATPYNYNHTTYDEYKEFIDTNKKLPWDVIDCYYLTSLAHFFDAYIHQNIGVVPALINYDMVNDISHMFTSNPLIVNAPELKMSYPGRIKADFSFEYCYKLKDASSINVHALSGRGTFLWCGELEKAPVAESLFGNCEEMFNHCTKLSEVPKYDTYECENMSSMFAYCESLKGEFPWTIDCMNVEENGLGFMFGGTGITKVTLKNVPQAYNPDNPNNKLGESNLGAVLGDKNIEVVVENYRSW